MKGKLETKNYEWILLKPKGKEKSVLFVPRESNVTLRDVIKLGGNFKGVEVDKAGVWIRL